MSTVKENGDGGDAADPPKPSILQTSNANDQPQSPIKRKGSPNSADENDEKKRRIASDEEDADGALDPDGFLTQSTSPANNIHSDENLNDHDTKGNANGYGNHPDPHGRLASLPLLESVSDQLLKLMFNVDKYLEIATMIAHPDHCEPGQVYATQKALFDSTRAMYSKTAGFLSAENLGITTAAGIAILRKANLASFVCRVFGSPDFDFYSVDAHFIDVFVPFGGELDDKLAALFLDLKTQVFVASLSQGTAEQALLDLFPDNFGVKLLERHPDKEVTLSESKFLTEMGKRRDLLRRVANDGPNDSLADQYPWDDFLRALFDYLSPIWKQKSASNPNQNGKNGHSNGSHNFANDQGIKHALNLACEAALNEGPVMPSHDGLPRDNHSFYSGHNGLHGQQNAFAAQLTPMPPDQSAPTLYLYEQARNINKSSSQNRKPGNNPSQRRPWSQEEENALMAGLDQVRGPHWSQILILYGEKGTISEVLKDRSQVQLKDKARNLKLFFLKSNIEVPYYLRCVTGELKTRAPSLAQRKEAEERMRVGGPEAPNYQAMPVAAMNGQQNPYQPQPQVHHSPYGPPQLPPPQQQPQPFQQAPPDIPERSSSEQGPEILDPVGPTSEPKIKTPQQTPPLIPSAPPSTTTQEQKMQRAMQEMSTDEHQLASRLKDEAQGHDAAGQPKTSP